MEINKELILKVAKNSRLELTEKEIKEFLPQLKQILEAFSKIKEVKTDNIKPSFQPIELKNIYREDKVEACLPQEYALKNTRHKRNNFFIGPKTF